MSSKASLRAKKPRKVTISLKLEPEKAEYWKKTAKEKNSTMTGIMDASLDSAWEDKIKSENQKAKDDLAKLSVKYAEVAGRMPNLEKSVSVPLMDSESDNLDDEVGAVSASGIKTSRGRLLQKKLREAGLLPYDEIDLSGV